MLFRQLFDTKSSTYTYLIASAKGREALIIDPVEENVNEYVNHLKELDLKLVKVIDTHIHADHVTGASKLKNNTNCSTVMGENSPAETVDIRLKDEETIEIDQLKIKALYTPGHTSDSYSFLMNNYLFSGDTLLINGSGRTDFQGGDPLAQYNSIFNRLLKLPEETLVYPAHDYKGLKSSTIGQQKKTNPRQNELQDECENSSMLERRAEKASRQVEQVLICEYLKEKKFVVAGGVAAGSSLYMVRYMMKGISNLQADGTMKHNDAIGETGQVYTRIRKNSTGEIQVSVDGTLRTLEARARDTTLHIQSGELIRVVDVIGATMIVEPINDGDEELTSEEE